MYDIEFPEHYGKPYWDLPVLSYAEVEQRFGDLPGVMLDVQHPELASAEDLRFVICKHQKRLRATSGQRRLTWETRVGIWRSVCVDIRIKPLRQPRDYPIGTKPLDE